VIDRSTRSIFVRNTSVLARRTLSSQEHTHARTHVVSCVSMGGDARRCDWIRTRCSVEASGVLSRTVRAIRVGRRARTWTCTVLGYRSSKYVYVYVYVLYVLYVLYVDVYVLYVLYVDVYVLYKYLRVRPHGVRTPRVCCTVGLGGLVRLGTVPPYHCTKHFVWANSTVPKYFGTYQKNSWYRGHFSSQYGVRSLRGAFAR
jgi:hypothetical protein